MNKNIHKEKYYHSKNSNTVVIFIHGIRETPNQFEYLNRVISENGYSFLNLLLPGHGKTPQYFAKNGYKKWENYINENVNEMAKIYGNIVFVGHSMGCLLAINRYLTCKDKVRGIFCISIPIDIKVSFKGIINTLKVQLKLTKYENETIKIMKKVHSTGNTNLFSFIIFLPRYLDLLYLSYKIKYNLKNIDIPIIYVQSFYDELVSIISAVTIRRILRKKEIGKDLIIVLKDSGHFYYAPKDRDIIIKNMIKFLNMTTKSQIN